MKLVKFLIAFIIITGSSNFTYSQSTETHQQPDSTQTIVLKVKGITCSMDLKMISANVEKLKGVSSCIVDKQGTTTTFKVKFNSALVSKKEICETIEATGSCEDPDERPYKVKQ